MTLSNHQRYWEIARQASRLAYAPYSKFQVGALLIGRDGREFAGCNVENASYGLCICAERTAATRAIVEGCRDWDLLFVVSPTSVAPCGACRQFLHEFAPDLQVYISGLNPDDPIRQVRLADLLPDGLAPNDVLRVPSE